jgi:hypothetical protein
VLSVIVHAGLLIGILKLEIALPGMLSRIRLPERTRPMKLAEVRRAPESPMDEAEDTAPTIEDVVDTAEKLGVPVPTSLLAPPVAPAAGVGSEAPNLAEPDAPSPPEVWQPRQEIIAIEKTVSKLDVAPVDRITIPALDRVIEAPDLALPVERSLAAPPPLQSTGPGKQTLSRSPSTASIVLPTPLQTTEKPPPAVVPSEAVVEEGTELFKETPEEITPLKPIERVLAAKATTYESRWDRNFGYFKVDIQGLGTDVLPVMPKDVILMQDCSASMAEQRLYFCRQGLNACLDLLGDNDRFDVIGFRQTADRCFGTLVDSDAANIAKAREFIADMRPGGNTDILSSIRDLVALQRESGRPIIVLMVSDGLATAGQTGSSDIIGEFSQMNEGMLSFYTIGTVQTADQYLLDLLSYSNRGEVIPLGKGRWSIPESIRDAMDKISRPVLADVGFRFPVGSKCEVYPVQTSNLYLDRPLTLYGRYPRGEERVAFQAVGEGLDVKCDMLFDVSLADGTAAGDKDLRSEWAKQKVYHLIGQYARRQDPDTLREIRETAREYKVNVPHRGKF